MELRMSMGRDSSTSKDLTLHLKCLSHCKIVIVRCPFTECEKNTGRKIAQMGFKEYAIHIAVRHHLMESLMHEIKTPEMADMLEEVMAARHARGEQVLSFLSVCCL